MIQITTTPVLEKVEVSVAKNGTATLSFSVKVTETDLSLSIRYVGFTIDWGDGSAPVEVLGSVGILRSYSVTYKPGIYQIRIHAWNERSPTPDTADYFISVKVTNLEPEAKKPGVLYGPILPKDEGFPNRDQWKMQRGTDLEVISSSIKMLLITNLGDRIMQPDYGTNLRSILFEHDITTIETLAKEDILSALSKWEPRAKLLSLSVTRKQAREAHISAIFESTVHQSHFPVEVTINA